MTHTNPVVSIDEARNILGELAANMSDQEITELIDNLDVLATEALRIAREKRMKQDATDMANLIYDIYKEKLLKNS